MASRSVLLCLLILSLSVNIDCWRSRGSSSSRSSSHSSSHSSYKPSYSRPSYSSGSSRSSYSSGSSYKPSYSSSSGSHSYPTSSSGLSGGSSRPSYPTSSSGLSGGSSRPSYPSYPSSSSGLSGSSSHSYPTSSSGLSGGSSKPSYPTGSGLSGGSSKPSYPTGSGLSGSSSHGYPTSSSGLSGSSKPSYPTGSGLSGGSYKPSYPTGNGLSGSGSHGYPPSVTGLSGGSKPTYPTNNGNYINSNKYTPSYSGSPNYNSPKYPVQQNSYRPSHTYNTNSAPHYPVYVPSYYSTPQYVYVNQYRNSDSRYGDVLTGLALYNMGRSHNRYHEHYYYDDYYRNRYEPQSYTGYRPENRPKDEAVCTLKIKENGKYEALRIPCEIVSTFTQDSHKETPKLETQVNTTVCTIKTTVINNYIPVNTTAADKPGTNGSLNVLPLNGTTLNGIATNGTNINGPMATITGITSNGTVVVLPVVNGSVINGPAITGISGNGTTVNIPSLNVTAINMGANVTTINGTVPGVNGIAINAPVISGIAANGSLLNPPIVNTTIVNASTANGTAVNGSTVNSTMVLNSTVVNVTVCTTNSSTTSSALDPLTVKGPKVDSFGSNMECMVEIKTRDALLRNNVDCNTLMQYSKMPEPKKETSVLPDRSIISVCWVSGAGVGLLPLFGWHKADSAPGCYFVEVMDYNYLLFLYFATIVTPSVLLAAFYAHIYRVVLKQLSEVMTVGGSRGRITGGGTMLRVLGAAQKREVKATQNLAVIVFFFIICWIPLYTINAIKAFMPDLDIPNPLTYFCVIFSHLNSAINPFLYAYHLKDFRAALKGLFCTVIGRGVTIQPPYRPPIPVGRQALERSNALRIADRPKIYINSPVWLQQRKAEMSMTDDNRSVATPAVQDVEPFLNSTANGSSGTHTPECRDSEAGPYLIENQECCQSPYRKVERFIRRVRSVSIDHS